MIAVVAIGGISSGLAYVFYCKDVQASSAVIASIILLDPVTGVILSARLLHGHYAGLQVAGIAGLLVTTVYLSTSDLMPRPTKQSQSQRR